MQPEIICARVIETAKQAGRFILGERKGFDLSKIEIKGKNDLVSYVDKSAEKQITEGLRELIPGAGFITEEKTETVQGETYNWIIDPLDGTTNFIHGIPCYCVSIGLTRGRELIMGVIYEPNLDECFYAWEGSPAYLNGKEISVSGIGKLENSLLATGFPSVKYSRMKPYMEVFDYCMHNTHGLRRWGSAAIDLAYVAAGRFEGFYEYGLNSWDVSAGAFIVMRAGGKVSDFSGGDNFLFGEEIIACNAGVYNEFLELVKSRFSA
jgi:myo-inositol-1(or 4)-monophosphatase